MHLARHGCSGQDIKDLISAIKSFPFFTAYTSPLSLPLPLALSPGKGCRITFNPLRWVRPEDMRLHETASSTEAQPLTEECRRTVP